MLSNLTRARGGAPGLRLPLPAVTPVAVWSGVVAFAIAIGLASRLLHDGDTFLHVAAGDWIRLHGVVPQTDPFSATRLGAPWTAHEWLAELLFAEAHAAAGWAGVVTLTALAIGASFAILAAGLAPSLPARGVAAMLAASFLLVAPHLTARPHVLAMPLMIAWTVGLVAARRRDSAPSFWLLALLLVWANLHGSWLIAIALAAGFGLEAVSAAPAARFTTARNWGAFIAAAIAVSLVGPPGVGGWRFPFELARMPYALSLVGEWRATDFSHFQPLEIWLLGLLAAGLLGRIRLAPVRLAMLLGLFHLALTHARFSDEVAMLAPLILGDALAPFFGARPSKSAAFSRSQAAIAFIITAGLTLFGVTRGIANDDAHIAPVRAVDKIGNGAVFNDYDFGDYLIFRGKAPFVDGRLDIYGDGFLRDYTAALDGEDGMLAALIRRHHVRWALLRPDRPAVASLRRLPGWRQLYADPGAVVFVNARPSG
jgi:hypothetical protein